MSPIKSVNAECSFFIFATGACGNQSASACGKDCRKDDYQGLFVGHLNPVSEKFRPKFHHRIAMCITQPWIVAIFAFTFHAYSPFVLQREFELPHRKYDNHHSWMTEFVSSTGTNHRLWPNMPAPMYQDSIRGYPLVQMCSRFVCMCAYVCLCRKWRW